MAGEVDLAVAVIELRSSPSYKNTRDAWARFLRTKRKNFHPHPNTRFVICSALREESCFTGAFDSSQRRQIKLGILLTIWKKRRANLEMVNLKEVSDREEAVKGKIIQNAPKV